jgi:hypothetical protein
VLNIEGIAESEIVMIFQLWVVLRLSSLIVLNVANMVLNIMQTLVNMVPLEQRNLRVVQAIVIS